MYKNWIAICQIPDAPIMRALALLNMDSDLGRKFVKRFPEYFTQEKQAGPYPLSLMREVAREKYNRSGEWQTSNPMPRPEDVIVRFGGVPEWLPKQGFYYGEDPVKDGSKLTKLPTGIHLPPEAKQGDSIMIDEKQFIILEIRHQFSRTWGPVAGELWIAPAEFVHIDC